MSNSVEVDLADTDNENECQYLSSSSVANGSGGEDLCERAVIQRKIAMNSSHVSNASNGSVAQTMALSEHNERYIQSTLDRDHRPRHNCALSGLTPEDYEMESILRSCVDIGSDDSDESEDDIKEVDSMAEASNQSDSAKNWSSNVFLPPIRDQQYVEQGLDLEFAECLDSCLDYCSVPPMPRSYRSYQKAYGFNKSFLERLKRLDAKDVRLELHLWPSILKGFSISCISGPKSGKTNAYLMPLINWFDTNHENQKPWVGAIVICSSTRQTYDIARQARKWREPDAKRQTLRIVSLNSSNESKQLNAVLNGCDLLITTPEPLLRAMSSSVIDSSSTRCLIIDEADVSLALHKKTILKIYLSFAAMKKQKYKNSQRINAIKGNSMAFQTILLAEKWTKDVKWFSKEVQHLPVVVFGSYYEASIAFGIECNIVVIEEERDRVEALKRLVHRLQSQIRSNGRPNQMAIVCRTVDEINVLKRRLGVKSVVVTDQTNHFNLEELSTRSRNGAVLFITDMAIKLCDGFRKSIDTIIHYKLAFTPINAFGDRFLLMSSHLKRYKNPFDGQNTANLVNYVVVSPADRDQIPQLIAYLSRLNVPVPDQLKDMCAYGRRKLCSYYSSLAKCPFLSFNCWNRHSFNRYDRPLPGLPVSGQIKIVVTYVLGANQFFFRLNAFRGESQTSGKWQAMDSTYDEIRPKLNALKNSAFNTINRIADREVYGIAIRGEVFRVRLTQILGTEEIHFYEEYDPSDSSQVIELFCIDFGHKLRSRSRQLFRLPEELKCLPAFALRAHLFGIKPIDNEIEWDFRSTQTFYELIDNFRVSQVTAWVLKQVDGLFWLNRLNVQKRLKNAKLVVDSNPIDYLLEQKFVDKNEKRLSNANNDYNKIVNIWRSNQLTALAFNSCLVDETSYVVVSDFVDIEHLYVIHENGVKRLKQLEDKWLSSLEPLKALPEVAEQQICFYKYKDIVYNETSLNRARVMSIDGDLVDLFLVDHGETVGRVPTSSLYRIHESHIRELPFQAIKVALFGVRAVKPITYDLICQLTRNKEDQYLCAIAQRISNEKDVNLIRLFVANDSNETQFIALSKLLVDLNYAQYVDSEDENQLVITIDKISEELDPNQVLDDYSEYMDRRGHELANDFVKEILQTFGPNECEDTDGQKEETKSGNESKQAKEGKESRMSKLMRRLKAIKLKNSRLKRSTTEAGNGSDSDDPNEAIDKCLKDFDYSVDPSVGISYYDSDDPDVDSLHSDEDPIFEEEELA